jgi:hypothetical protein
MSYCRCGEDSDVYVYGSVLGGWTIHIAADISIESSSIPLGTRQLNPQTRGEAIDLLLELRKLGLKVPERAIARFRREIGENEAK